MEDSTARTVEGHINGLIAWGLHHGALIDQNVEVYEDPLFGISLRVKLGADDLNPHTKVISCPFHLSLSYLNAFDVFVDLRSHGTVNFGEQFLRNTHPRIIGHFFLMLQYLKGEKSYWFPYIQSLPQPDQPEKIATPLYYSDAEREWLKGTILDKVVDNRERDWKAEFEQAFTLLHEDEGFKELHTHFTWDLYKWAASIFSSRSFISGLIPPAILEEVASGQEHRTQILSERQAGRTTQPILFPLVDIANHSTEARVTWFQNAQNHPRDLSIVVDTSIASGQQIFNNYAPKGNTELLLGYGFILPDNDEVTLVLKRPPEDIMKLRRRQTSYQKPTHPETEFNFTIHSRPYTRPETCLPEFCLFSTGCVDLLSLLTANERELELLSQNPTLSLEVSSGDMNGPLVRNTCHVVTVLIEKIRGMLASIASAGSNLGAPSNQNQRTAEAYRNGQIGLLQSSLTALESRLSSYVPGHQVLPSAKDKPPILITIRDAFEWLERIAPNLYHHLTAKLAEEFEVNLPIDWNELIVEDWDAVIWTIWIYTTRSLQLDQPHSEDIVLQWVDAAFHLYSSSNTPMLFHGAADEYQTVHIVKENIDGFFNDFVTSQAGPPSTNDLSLIYASILADELTIPFPKMNGLEKQKVLCVRLPVFLDHNT